MGARGEWPARPRPRELGDAQTQRWWPDTWAPEGPSQHHVLQMLIIRLRPEEPWWLRSPKDLVLKAKKDTKREEEEEEEE